jgi:hypothetical protein
MSSGASSGVNTRTTTGNKTCLKERMHTERERNPNPNPTGEEEAGESEENTHTQRFC